MKNRGAITLVFDDGYQHIYEQVVPLLNQLNIPGVFAIPMTDQNVRYRDRIKLRPWQQWLNIVKQGHELASHSILHRDLTNLSKSEVEHELAASAKALNTRTLVYPGGAINDQIVAVASRYYQAARSVKHGFETLPPRDPMRLRTFNFRRGNFSVLKANLLAVWAYLSNTWLIETYHIIDNHEIEARHTVPFKDFNRHLNFIARLPVNKATIMEIIRSYD